MKRADLLALDASSLIVLANAGLVKRAQREVESGVVPALEEDEDGTLHAAFRDGASTRLPPNVTLRATLCSCGAAAVCRHRIAAVLAYQKLHAGAATSTAAPGAVEERWNPGDVSDEELERVAPHAAELARKATSGSMLARTVPGARPTVELPASTVQFLVPHNLTFAKCDCARASLSGPAALCEHVVLAVWAFRAKPEGGVVELGAPASTRMGEHPAGPRRFGATEDAVEAVVTRGMADSHIGQTLREARANAEREELIWIADALADLERQKEAYDRQSALFRAGTCTKLVAEIAARVRAAVAAHSASPSHDLPARWILGKGEPRATRIDQVRLTALGARIEADGDRRIAFIYFAERDAKTILVLRKEWTFAAGETPKNGADLGAMFASSRLPLAALAKGELVARAAQRRANGEIDLSLARGMKSNVLPGSAFFGDLPSPLLIRDLAAFEAERKGRPPSLLSPRKVGERIHVVEVTRVVDARYDPGAQELTAVAEDAAGTRLDISVGHRAVSPGAVDAFASMLESGTPLFVSGELSRTMRGWRMSPLTIAGARICVLDLEPAPRASSAFIHAAAGHPPPNDEVESVFEALGAFVDRVVVRGVGAAREDAGTIAKRLEDVSMPHAAALVRSTASGRPRSVIDLAVYCALAHAD